MCSCLMLKWLVSLFASQIVKLDIKFYERVPGPVLVSSVLCFLFSPFDDAVVVVVAAAVTAAAVAVATQICPAPVFGHGANFDA